jgi:hypothetical protein
MLADSAPVAGKMSLRRRGPGEFLRPRVPRHTQRGPAIGVVEQRP